MQEFENRRQEPESRSQKDLRCDAVWAPGRTFFKKTLGLSVFLTARLLDSDSWLLSPILELLQLLELLELLFLPFCAFRLRQATGLSSPKSYGATSFRGYSCLKGS